MLRRLCIVAERSRAQRKLLLVSLNYYEVRYIIAVNADADVEEAQGI